MRLKSVSYSPLGPLHAWELRGVGMWYSLSSRGGLTHASPPALRGQAGVEGRAEDCCAREVKSCRREDSLDVTLFHSYLCFRQHLTSSPIWPSSPALVSSGRILAFSVELRKGTKLTVRSELPKGVTTATAFLK